MVSTEKKDHSFIHFSHLACFSQATAFNYCCPSGTDTVMEYVMDSFLLVMHLGSSSFFSGSGINLWYLDCYALKKQRAKVNKNMHETASRIFCRGKERMQEENHRKGGDHCFSLTIIMELRRRFSHMNINIKTLKLRDELLCMLDKGYEHIPLGIMQ